MDYNSLQLADLGFMAVYTLFAGVLAWQNRTMLGLRFIWFGLFLGLVRVILQIVPVGSPAVFSVMLPAELYLVTFVLQMLGMRWFVDRSPLARRWPFLLIAAAMTVYAALFLERVGHSAFLLNVPIIVVCGTTASMLLRSGKELFRPVARVGAAFLLCEMLTASYLALLTQLAYPTPWKYVEARHDPRVLYSILVMMLLAACVAMCDLWLVITELQSELIKQATLDTLTGALNRRALLATAVREFSRCRRSGYTMCVLLLDIDHFKDINDKYGHATGDAALRFLTVHVRGLLRPHDILARTGGEEFTILLPETTAQNGKMVAERLRHSVETAKYMHKGVSYQVTVSIGVAEPEPACADFESLWHRADMAMYEAKRLGRNRVFVDGSEVAAGSESTLSTMV